ncbi:MAG TPA: DUF1501 domain-containing protein [Chloroflexota bacterium]|nr:DUF1501 domain-containing protein [Chloroflexota bacterium]
MLITRRTFLKGAAIVAASTSFAPSFLARTAYTALAAGNNALVVIQLSGGNDGINTVIPYGTPQYAQSRPTLAIGQDQVLPLDANVGLHPNLKALKDLFDQKMLAVVQGVGYPNPNRSHFSSMDIWQTGSPDHQFSTGWLGRYDEANLQGQKLGALNFGAQLPRTFWTDHTVVPSIGSLSNYQYLTDPKAPDDTQAQIDAINKIFNNPVGRDGADFFRQSAIDAFQTAAELKAAVAGTKSTAQYPATAFGRQLQLVGQLIGSKLGSRIYYVSTGGFDTHANEKTTHDRLMQQLNDGIDAFVKDLQAQGTFGNTAVMTFSEFGRRVKENGSGGTDHGTAEPMFLIGGGLQGGLYGSYPSMSDLDVGDLKFTTDFRSVYGTIVGDWLGADPGPVVGGSFPKLPIFGH